MTVEVAPATQLQHQVNVLLVTEKGIELGNVGVVQETLDFDLPDQLLNKAHFATENAFWDFLQSTNKIGSSMSESGGLYLAR